MDMDKFIAFPLRENSKGKLYVDLADSEFPTRIYSFKEEALREFTAGYNKEIHKGVCVLNVSTYEAEEIRVGF